MPRRNESKQMTRVVLICDACNEVIDTAKPAYSIQSKRRSPSVDADVHVECLARFAERMNTPRYSGLLEVDE